MVSNFITLVDMSNINRVGTSLSSEVMAFSELVHQIFQSYEDVVDGIARLIRCYCERVLYLLEDINKLCFRPVGYFKTYGLFIYSSKKI